MCTPKGYRGFESLPLRQLISCSKTFRHNVWLRLTPIERALAMYYADLHSRDITTVIRGMIKQYTRADRNFDPKKFKRFVEERVLVEAKDDRDLQAETREQVRTFLDSMGKT